MVRSISAFLATGCITALLTGCSASGQIQAMDASEVHLLQFTNMVEGEEIAVVSTDAGDFTMRLFPSEAPKTVENFITLSKQGYYDGTTILCEAQAQNQEPEHLLVWGAEENGHKGRFVAENRVKEEYSCNLAQFPGAVTAYQPDGNHIDSRFYIVGTHPVSQSALEEMEKSNYPQHLIEKFAEVGGYPETWLNASVFGQVIEGMDVVDTILNSQQDGCTPTATKILKIEIKKYQSPNND